ncbi:MAG: hypothetical protein RL594_331 [Bacteroidota bacterium]|jgi:DNA-binding NarL/FixJ family response regulator
MDQRPIRIAIVEDDTVIRSGISSNISSDSRFECRHAVASIEELLSFNDLDVVDVFLLDIGLPGMSGIDGIEHIRQRNETAQVLMLTNFEDHERIRLSVFGGARGYLLKTTPPSKLLDALQEIHEGGAPMTSHIARTILEYMAGLPKPSKLDELTDREMEVLRRISDRRQYREIAEELFISLDTVRTHVRNIYSKLNVHKRRQAERIYREGMRY